MKNIENLSEAECWRLLAANGLGRLAVLGDEGIDIFPVNYIVNENVIFFRSAPGGKLADIAMHPEVAFEADGTHRWKRWSVVLKGTAKRLSLDKDIEESGILGLDTDSPTVKWNYVRIVPGKVTGRRF